ncbi:MAG: nitrous oxide-stimulated promoter family protein [Pirellulaceae bacterium]|nr:nitrous oxide-stimulated promoter family protein [Pirellulaceae bacterium]
MKRTVFTQHGGEAPRLRRERRTVTAMLQIYCRGHHGSRKGLCEACSQLHAYAMRRLDCCPFGADKPSCAACPIHCYRADRRQEIREVMRYAGPRMLWRHPWLAIRHVLDERRPDPTKTGRAG